MTHSLWCKYQKVGELCFLAVVISSDCLLLHGALGQARLCLVKLIVAFASLCLGKSIEIIKGMEKFCFFLVDDIHFLVRAMECCIHSGD